MTDRQTILPLLAELMRCKKTSYQQLYYVSVVSYCIVPVKITSVY